MQNYYFEFKNPLRPYTHSLPAMPDTVAPANALRTAPPEKKDGVWFGEKNGTWVYIEDHRKKTGYVNGEPYTINEYGPLPSGWSDTPPPPTTEQCLAAKVATIDAETSAAITAGFDYAVDGLSYHFSYDTFDQQNFADTANVALLAQMGGQGLPESVDWNAYKNWVDGKGDLVRLKFTAETFLALYTGGAVAHKAARMAEGGARKAALAEAVASGATAEELEAI